MRFVLGLAAVAATALLTVAASAEDQCAPLKVMAHADLVTLPKGRIMVPMTVAGENVYFAVNTAAPMTSITAGLAEKLNLPREHSDVSFVGLDGRVSNKLAIAPELGIGPLRAEHVKLLLIEGPRAQQAPQPGAKVPSGELGADFLSAYDVDLDFGANTLNLISPEHCEGNVLYWKSERLAKLPITVMDNGKIYFTMNLDGHDLETVLNTCIPMSTLRLSTAKSLYDVDNDTVGNQREGALGNGTALYSHQFKTMTIEGLTIANPRLVLMPSLAEDEIRHMQAMHGRIGTFPGTAQKQPELVLGMRELRQLHVYIDYRGRTIYFSPATPGGDAPKKEAAGP